MSELTSLRNLLDSNFIEYASYVIKERAIPFLEDGLKPVQRRILHTLQEVDDGKFHKVANIVGMTMRYHPHGDASIEAALVHIAQKDFFIDKQGNFGNIVTGDPASAARYIECRLTPLARETLFNSSITNFEESYDGRNLEPLYLPAKVPVLLMSGAEGIAVGLATKILPHNFIELLEAQIAILRQEPFELYPDFIQGGLIDVEQYQEGMGKVKVRAKIDLVDNKTLVIREIPYGTTTENLISSIEKAIHRGKLKISSINDFTSESVEIELKVGHGIQAEKILPRLFLYTDCEMSISTQCIVIKEGQPAELSVHDVLRANTDQLVDTLQAELQFLLKQLIEKLFSKMLTKIFIEHKLYAVIEEAENDEELFESLSNEFIPYHPELEREPVYEDFERLINIPIKRISRFDYDKTTREIEGLEKDREKVEKQLASIKRYTINYLKGLIKNYSNQYTRQTEIDTFEVIKATKVAVQDLKLGYDKKEKFIGLDVKSEETIQCSSFDKLLIFYRKGYYKVMDLPDKLFLKERILHFERQISQSKISVVYLDMNMQRYFMKRFVVSKFILEKVYQFIPEDAKLMFFSADENPIIRVDYAYRKRMKTRSEFIHLGRILVKSVSSRGNRVSDYLIDKITQVKQKQYYQLFEEQPVEVHRLRNEMAQEPQPTLFDSVDV